MDAKTKAEKFGEGVQFQRIRRITGYLVGTMEQWNNAKRAEERDRVKHEMKPKTKYRQGMEPWLIY